MALADFTEQRQVVTLLQRSLERGRLGHAYLFSGSRMEDLEPIARALAKVLNCLQPPQSSPEGLPLESCDQCVSCRKIDNDLHSDVRWVRPEAKTRIITVDQIRTLLQSVNLKANEGQYKVAILAGVDRLNVNAANAFLKTLEEPPKKSVLLLLTTEPQRVLETILSRCLRLTFAGGGTLRVEPALMEWLGSFAKLAASTTTGLLARYQLLGALLTELGRVRATVEQTLTERSPLGKYEDIEPDLRERWEKELTASIEAEYRRRRGELLGLVQWWLRDVWLSSHDLADASLQFSGLSPHTTTIAKRITPDQAQENLRALEKTIRLLFTNVQESLALEVGLLKLAL